MNTQIKEAKAVWPFGPVRASEYFMGRNAVTTLVSRDGNESILQGYTEIIRGRCNLPHFVVHYDADECFRPGCLEEAGEYGNDFSLVYDAGDSIVTCPMGFLITDWGPDEDRIEGLLWRITGLNIPAMLVRQLPEDTIHRVVVAKSSGTHALQQLWVAKEIAHTLGVPLHVLCLPSPLKPGGDGESHARESNIDELIEEGASHLLGIQADFDTCLDSNVVDGIARRIHAGDLLIMAVPSPIHIFGQFSESIPAAVARRVKTPLILFFPKRPMPVTLRRLFWGDLILPDLHPGDKEAAISELVEAVIRQNQVPISLKQTLIDLAMERERAIPSALDCQTAFPHIHLPGFRGVAGSMAICRDGVDFGSSDGTLSRFLFLLITPDGFCDEHLAIQSKIARRMVRPEVRAALLTCRNPADVLDILEPKDGKVGT